jgi:hypothetical protein
MVDGKMMTSYLMKKMNVIIWITVFATRPAIQTRLVLGPLITTKEFDELRHL